MKLKLHFTVHYAIFWHKCLVASTLVKYISKPYYTLFRCAKLFPNVYAITYVKNHSASHEIMEAVGLCFPRTVFSFY
jgi:hypothetical protein